MAEPVGALRVELSANAVQFEKDMGRARKAAARSAGAMGDSLDRFRGRVRGLTDQIFSLRGALAGLGVGLVLRGIIETSAEFQRLQTSLKTVTGSTEAATAAFNQIKRFAASTPFDLKQVTTAFVKLKALGLDPSEAALESYGNTASAMGKSLNDFIEAVADASTGEFERLKEFGIKAKSEGDKVTFTFQGVATTVRKSAEEIEQYLQRIGNVQFAGAMEEQSKTLGGALSNLGDAVTVFQNEIGEGGFAQAIEDLARQMSGAAEGSHNLAREIGSALGSAVRGFASAARFAAENIRGIVSAVTALIALKAATLFFGLAGAVVQFTLATVAAARATTLLNAVLSKSVLGVVAKLAIVLGAGALSWQLMGKEAMATADAVEAAAANIQASINGAAGDTSGIKKLRNALKDEFENLELLIKAHKSGTKAVENFNDALIVQEKLRKVNIERMSEEGQKLVTLILLNEKMKRALEDVARIYAETRTPAELYAATVERLNELLNEGSINQGTFNRAVGKAQDELADANDKAKDGTDLVKDFGLSFSSAAEDALLAGAKISDVINGLIKDLTRLLARKLVLQPLADAAGGFLDGLLGNSGIGAVQTQAKTDVATLPFFAKGGDHGGGFRIVGEKGPELEATGPSRIFSAEETAEIMGGGGGGDMTVNVYAPPGSNVRTQENNGPGGRSLDVIIDEAVGKLITTPGSRTGRAMQTRFGNQTQLKGRG